jgi:hypothetical protein
MIEENQSKQADRQKKDVFGFHVRLQSTPARPSIEAKNQAPQHGRKSLLSAHN